MRYDYTGVAKTLHWLITLLVFVLFPLAWVMDEFTGLAKFRLYNLHKSIGLTVLALMALRVLWRLARPAPALPGSIPGRERLAAHLGHFALYLTLFLMPLTGWAMISSSDKPSVLYMWRAFPLLPWLSELPADQKKAWEETFFNAHGILANVLLVLIAIHVAATLRHSLWLKDGVLARMIPRFMARKPVNASVAVLAAALFLVPQNARAAEWNVDKAKSTIGFAASGSGYNASGTFSGYKADIRFDPDMPDKTSIRVTIDMKTAATGTADVDQTLQTAEFFNPAKFPTAEFVAKGALPAEDGHYILKGQLTLKGVTKPVDLPFAIEIAGGTAGVKAETTINRLDYGVGAATVAGLAIDKDVKLTFDLTALRMDN